jgi:hypothetical protein
MRLWDKINIYRTDSGWIRDDPTFTRNPYAFDEVKSWGSRSEPKFDWNTALTMAAKHVAQIEGPCGTYGDANGDYVEEVLSQYYAYNFEDLQILRIESTELIQENTDGKNENVDHGPAGENMDSAHYAMEHILSQECIDKKILWTPGSNI